MATIQIDFDVEKALFALRETEEMTFNDVLRKKLGLPPKQQPIDPKPLLPWNYDKISLPHGTELRLNHQGREHRAEIVDGLWILNGKPQNSPTAAARTIIDTKAALNGWWKWEAKRPGDVEWEWLGNLRKEAEQMKAIAP
ncbi:conserved protein of unknown function (plasmid) [Rhodovastum atsumiense]|nr:hypothetical protein [Rhodovastum atsumiense]CAH2606274.1 conserved protein of unknown function [Rhodovastum atsumiense]